MSARAAPSIEPVMLEGTAGPIFVIYHPPPPGLESGLAFVHVPAFAEEMNCSRRMVALQARRLAKAGTGVLVLDPYGTGDSGGDFRDAKWSTWLGDIATAAAWLRSRGHSAVGLWGSRLGALLAMQAASENPAAYRQMLLWQPVLDGRIMLTQFLRLRVANVMGGGGRETTSDLRAMLAAGQSIEVAGYELSPELAEAIDAARIEPLVPPPQVRVDWLEVAPEPDRGLGPASQRILETWRAAGASVSAASVQGQSFWAIQETVLAPELVAATTRSLQP